MISDWFSDDEVLSQLKCFFEPEEMGKINTSALNDISEVDGGFKLVYCNRVFFIEEQTGSVVEVTD